VPDEVAPGAKRGRKQKETGQVNFRGDAR